MENDNKKVITKAFEDWAQEKGSFFDLLEDDAQWTITGNSAISKIYNSRQQFLDEAIIPINKRFDIKIKPKVREIYADGDTVIVLWDGLAVALDGVPYSNTYSWYLAMRAGKIYKAVAFFDAIELNALWERVKIE